MRLLRAFDLQAANSDDNVAEQVELYADYEPSRLMAFLVSSQAYALEAAAELCEARGLVREQVLWAPSLLRVHPIRKLLFGDGVF